MHSFLDERTFVSMFVVITDEVENEPFKQKFFPTLFKSYVDTVNPHCRIALVSFRDQKQQLGRMQSALVAAGVVRWSRRRRALVVTFLAQQSPSCVLTLAATRVRTRFACVDLCFVTKRTRFRLAARLDAHRLVAGGACAIEVGFLIDSEFIYVCRVSGVSRNLRSDSWSELVTRVARDIADREFGNSAKGLAASDGLIETAIESIAFIKSRL